MRLVPLVLSVMLVAGCGGPDPAPPPRSTTSTTTTTTTTATATGPVISDDVGASMGAVDTVLGYCTPGLPGDRTCDWAGLSSVIAEVTTGLRPGSRADLTVELDAMDAAVAAFAPCAEWFDSGAAVADPAGCDQAWYALTSDWENLKTAARWP
jgi:hypothetical protein